MVQQVQVNDFYFLYTIYYFATQTFDLIGCTWIEDTNYILYAHNYVSSHILIH